MTNDNQDAVHWADALECIGVKTPAAHLRRLVAENDAKDALLRQAESVMEAEQKIIPSAKFAVVIAAIRQHLEGRA